MFRSHFAYALAIVTLSLTSAAGQEAPLASWNDGPSKQAILDFVGRITDEDGPGFVPVADRIAVSR